MEQQKRDKQISFLKRMLGEVICNSLDDDDVTEIMLNPDGSIWLESRKQGMYRAGEMSEFHAKNFLCQLASLKDLYLNEKEPVIETTLPFNNERIEGVLPPVTPKPKFTIRKPAKFVYSLESYVENKIMTEAQYNYICKALYGRSNILICGGPGTGKTTALNSMTKKMVEICESNQRVLVLEDTPEIQCLMPNLVELRTSKHINMTDLLRVAMRSRPDRILVGEVRDKAALDMLKSWNTGCPGGIATVHANSTEAAMLRISSLAQEANIPPPNHLIAETIDVVINIVREPSHPCGRRVKQVSELLSFEGDKFHFNHVGEQ